MVRHEPVSTEADIEMACRFLVQWPGVTTVWLFGSAARGRTMDWRSDLDFAVEGLAPTEHGRAWSELDQIVRREVDLVRWEDAGPVLRDQIQQWGRVLYER